MSVNIYNKAKDSLTRVDGGGSGAIAMTMAEWVALDPKPQDGTQIVITDDVTKGGSENPINDDITSLDKTWSSSKIALYTEDYIVESGSNENGYYRKWHSGLIEQWGKIEKGSNLSSGTDWTGYYSLPIPFSNTDFVVSLTPSTNASLHAGSELMMRPTSVSQMQIEWYNRNSSTTIELPIIMWSAKGF